MTSRKAIVNAPQVKDLIVEVDLPKPPTDDSDPKPIKESIMRFTMKNGTTPLFLDYKTFVQAIRLDYNDGKYVTLPQPEVMKAELLRSLSAGGKLRDRNVEESWALLEDLALYDNESWNDPRDFTKLVKAISLPQDVMMVPTTLSTAWKIPSKLLSNMRPRLPTKRKASDGRLSKFEADFKQQQNEITNKINTVLKAITDCITGALLSDTVKNPKLNVNSTSLVLCARSYPSEDPQCSLISAT
ncbi:hypothetical protein Tco_0702388 [Tanacetum coccineum]|uniref:MAK10-like protein n=1 Tax=Tanacetum coccineum TaxID=301880 RepID=A0ABQ4XX61_9ASTR